MRTLQEYIRVFKNVLNQQVNQQLDTSNNNIIFKVVTDEFLDYQYMYENTYEFNLLATKRPNKIQLASYN